MNTTSHPITPGSACGPAFYSGLRHVAFCWLLVMLPMGLGAGVGGVAKAADNRALQPPLSLTVFDCGLLQLDDVSSFGLTNAETPVRELFVPCYLIQHPQGKLMWDTGLPLAIAGQGPVELQPGATMVYRRSLLSQLADLDLQPADIDFIALSHMHFDHAGAANAFTAATLLIQGSEYAAAFQHAEDYPVFDASLYQALERNDTVILAGDYDVFGDGSVMILSLPGHTPGHQVLAVNLAATGPLVLSGDMYHFRASRTLRRVPEFNTDRDATLRSMDLLEDYLLTHKATLWIEHDQALAKTLRLAPASYQ